MYVYIYIYIYIISAGPLLAGGRQAVGTTRGDYARVAS